MYNAPVLKMPTSSRNTILLLILLLAFLIRIPFFSVPPERDEGGYATVAQIVLDGGMPYRDVVNFRAPGVYYIYAFLFKIFGERVEALRIGSAIFAILTSFIIFKFAGRMYGGSVGLLASLIYAVFSSGPLVQGSLANCEAFMMLPIVAATYIFYLGYKEHNRQYFFLSGIVTGVAYLIKEAALPNLLLLFIFLPLTCDRSTKSVFIKQLFKKFLIVSAGFALPIIAFYAYLYVNNALFDYLIGVYNWNKGYGTYSFDIFWRRLIDRGVYALGREYSFLWIASLIAASVMIIADRTIENLYAVLWILFSFVGVSLGSYFWPHYFIQMIPSLSIAAAYGLTKLYMGFKSQRSFIKTASLVSVIILSISIWYGIKTDYKFYITYTPDEISRNIYGGDIFVTAKKVAMYVKERTEPSDFVYQNRWDAEIYFLSNRRSPTKYTDHLFVHISPDPIKSIGELRDSLFYKEPKYIIWFNPRPGELSEFVVKPIIDVKYELETEIDGVKIYRLKGWKAYKEG